MAEHLKFLDECGVHLGLTRDYGRAAPGVRVPEATSEYGATRYTVLAALGLDGVTAALVFEGGLTKNLFEQYVELILAPTLSPGDIVLMDNLSAHKSQRVEDLIVARGARLEFLPPYSPDFNPMELCWAKVKPQLRTAKARTEATLVTALGEAFQTVTQDDLEGWFDHCGYIEV